MEAPRNGCAVTCWPLLPGELLAFLLLVYFFVLCVYVLLLCVCTFLVYKHTCLYMHACVCR